MPVRYPIRIVLAGLALGLIFDRLVFDHPLGLGFALFVGLILAALALTLTSERGAFLRLAPLRPGDEARGRDRAWLWKPL